jgi:hypothetical protein
MKWARTALSSGGGGLTDAKYESGYSLKLEYGRDCHGERNGDKDGWPDVICHLSKDGGDEHYAWIIKSNESSTCLTTTTFKQMNGAQPRHVQKGTAAQLWTKHGANLHQCDDLSANSQPAAGTGPTLKVHNFEVKLAPKWAPEWALSMIEEFPENFTRI